MKLLILGAGEYGQFVRELARNQFSEIDYLDDNSSIAVGRLGEYKNLKNKYQNAIVAIGNNEFRDQWLTKLEEAGYSIPIVLSSKAHISPSAVIERGCIVEPMAVINANAIVKKGSIVSSGAVVNHNAIVNECCHIDCNAVVGAGAVVPEKTHLNYGQVIKKVSKPDNWNFSE